MKLNLKILLLLPFLLLTNSCKRIIFDDVSPVLPGSPAQADPTFVVFDKPVVSEQTVIVTSQATVKSFTDTQIVFASLTGIRAVSDGVRGGRLAALDVTELKEGTILVASEVGGATEGFLVRITGVVRRGTDWVVTYVNAKLDEIFKDVHFKFSVPRNYSLPLNSKIKLEDATDEKGGKPAIELEIKGLYEEDYVTEVEVAIKDFTPVLFKYITTETTKTQLSVTENLGVGFDKKLKKSYKKDWDVRFGYVTVPFNLQAGPVPIRINIAFEVSGKVEAGVKSLALDFRFIDKKLVKRSGTIYTNGKKEIIDDLPTTAKNEPAGVESVGVEGEIKASLDAMLNISFYNQNKGHKVGDEFSGFTGQVSYYGKLTGFCDTKKGLGVKAVTGWEGKVYTKFDLVLGVLAWEFPFKITPETEQYSTVLAGFCSDTPTDPPTPVDNNTARTPTAVSTSDPHMKTFDQAAYDFMAAGEFVAARSGTDRFEIQVRQQEIKTASASGQVSFNTGLAMHTGSDAICVYPDGRLFVNQARVSLTSAGYPLRGGWAIQQTSQGMTVISTGGDQVEIKLFGTNLDFYTSLATSRKGTLKGLLGNFDGIATNDLVRGDTGQPVQNTFATLYPAFADSWRIKQAESLFVYDPGTNTDTYTDKAFPRQAISLTTQQRASAETACRNQGITDPVALQNCIVDVAVTGDNTMARRSLDFQTAGNVLNSFAIGQFLTTDVQLAYTSATAENSAAVLNTASSRFSRVVMQQGVNMRNGFVSEFSFTAEEFNPISCFYLAIWPTTPATRDVSTQSRAGFCFGISNGVGSTFFNVEGAYLPGTPAKATIAPFNDRQVHRVRISEKRLSTGKFRVEIYYDNLTTPVVSLDNAESIAQIIDAPQNTGYIEFQINQGEPSKVKVFNWTYQAQ